MRLSILLLLFCANAALGNVVLQVRETAGVARAGEVLQSGIPLPRSANVRDVASLAVVDAAGAAVPAEFRALARWNGGRNDAAAPIQWVLVAFPASVPANGVASYRLLLDGSVANPPPAVPLRVSRDGDRVTVDTGMASFAIGRAGLFDEIRLGQSTIANAAGSAAPHGETVVERAGALVAVVRVRGRRYVFTAGSGTAIVRQSFAWEGTEPRRFEGLRETLAIAMPPPFEITAIGSRNALPIRGTSATASIQQDLRPSRTAPPRYAIAVGTTTASGAKADGAMLSIRGAQGSLAVAFDHMHRYEPQAIRLLEGGQLAIDLAADDFWLAERQAMFATFAIGVNAEVWAPLNHPLRAWPDAAWFTASGAVDPVPSPTLPPQFADYDRAMREVLERTSAETDNLGVHGLMTFGLFPRHWGNPLLSDEVDCFGNDPTPQESWDDLYWCATWTDYHNAAYSAAAHAMRTGEVRWLDEIARPAALRQLFTQIYQCSPNDGYFYCGQAPAGYGGYRADFNSSHAYFDNLILYYWLTGDEAVVETLQRGATSMRNYLCTRRPAAACQPHDPPVDEWAILVGRVASQWLLAFRFVGLASNDASFLDDWRGNLGRAMTQHFVAVDGYGFLMIGPQTTDQLWMTALYDMKNLELLRRDTNDAPIGDPPRRPSEIITAYARSLARYGPPTWPNSFDVTSSGVRPTPGGSDPFLYDTGKATLAGPLATAASITNDPALRALATEFTLLAIRSSINERAPLGKIQAEYLARLHAAIATLTPPTPPRRRSVR